MPSSQLYDMKLFVPQNPEGIRLPIAFPRKVLFFIMVASELNFRNLFAIL